MINSIRDYILTAEGAADEFIENEEMDDKLDNEVSDIVISCCVFGMHSLVVLSLTSVSLANDRNHGHDSVLMPSFTVQCRMPRMLISVRIDCLFSGQTSYEVNKS